MTVKLDPETWSNLPRDIVQEIIQHLDSEIFIQLYTGPKTSLAWKHNSGYRLHDSRDIRILCWFPDSTGFICYVNGLSIGFYMYIYYQQRKIGHIEDSTRFKLYGFGPMLVMHDNQTDTKSVVSSPANLASTKKINHLVVGPYTVSSSNNALFFSKSVGETKINHFVVGPYTVSRSNNVLFFTKSIGETTIVHEIRGKMVIFSYDMKYIAWVNGESDLVIANIDSERFVKSKFNIRGITYIKWTAHYLIVFDNYSTVYVFHNRVQIFTRTKITSWKFFIDPKEGYICYSDYYSNPFITRVGEEEKYLYDLKGNTSDVDFSPDGSWVSLYNGAHRYIYSRESFYYWYLRF